MPGEFIAEFMPGGIIPAWPSCIGGGLSIAGAAFLLFRLRKKKKIAAPIIAATPTPTPTPMPIFSPSLDFGDGVIELVGVGVPVAESAPPAVPVGVEVGDDVFEVVLVVVSFSVMLKYWELASRADEAL